MKKDKSKNLLVYDAINKILIKNDVLAPSLYQENYKKSFIEIQDFGDQTVFKILKSKSTNKLILFKKIIKVLNQIQSIKSRNIKNWIYPIIIHNLTFINFMFDWGSSNKDIIGLLPPMVRQQYFQGRGTIVIIIKE